MLRSLTSLKVAGTKCCEILISCRFWQIFRKKIRSSEDFLNQKWKSREKKKSRVLNVARKRTFKSRGDLMMRKTQKLQKTVLNVAKVARKNSRQLVPATCSTQRKYYWLIGQAFNSCWTISRLLIPATFSTIKVGDCLSPRSGESLTAVRRGWACTAYSRSSWIPGAHSLNGD